MSQLGGPLPEVDDETPLGTADPLNLRGGLQILGEKYQELPEDVRENVKKVAKDVKGGGYLESYQKLNKEEKKKFIEVIVKIKGNQEYSSPHIYNEKKEVHDNIEVTTEDIKLVIKEVLGINLEIKNINV